MKTFIDAIGATLFSLTFCAVTGYANDLTIEEMIQQQIGRWEIDVMPYSENCRLVYHKLDKYTYQVCKENGTLRVEIYREPQELQANQSDKVLRKKAKPVL